MRIKSGKYRPTAIKESERPWWTADGSLDAEMKRRLTIKDKPKEARNEKR